MERGRVLSREIPLALCAVLFCACVPGVALADGGSSAGTEVTVWQAPQPDRMARSLPPTGDATPFPPIAALGACAGAFALCAGALTVSAKGGDDGDGS